MSLLLLLRDLSRVHLPTRVTGTLRSTAPTGTVRSTRAAGTLRTTQATGTVRSSTTIEV